MATIRLPEEVWAKVHDHLFSRPGEHFAFMLADHCRSTSGPVMLVKDAICVPDRYATMSITGWTVKPEGFLPAINAAVRSGGALIEAHNHGGRTPRFSLTDRAGLQEFHAYILDSLPGRAYCATVWGDVSVYGEFFAAEGNSDLIRSITVIGERFRQIVSRDDDAEKVDIAFDRQLPWFSEEGQRQLGRIQLAIIGVGGTGSHVAQQLAFLGVRDFVIVDHDSADDTSMNRLVTATASDIGTPKAVLARRLIKSVAPAAKVTMFGSLIQSRDVLDALKGVDVLFGCVDNDGARLILNEISRAYCIPYFDLATGIDIEAGQVTTVGGRVAVVTPAGPCLHCLDEIDADEARFFLSNPKERAFLIERGYVRGMNVKAPSVVSLNAAVAAAAINEFAIWLSGLRPLNVFTELDLLGKGHELKSQRLAPRRVPTTNPSCAACASSGLGDRAALDRYAQFS